MAKNPFDDSNDFQSENSGNISYREILISMEDDNRLEMKEVKKFSASILTAIKMRHKYMKVSNQSFHHTTSRHLSLDENVVAKTDQVDVNNKSVLKRNVHGHDPDQAADRLMNKMDIDFEYENGVMTATNRDDNTTVKCPIDYLQFCKDYKTLFSFVNDGPLKTFCYQRLILLTYLFKMHITLNESSESIEQKSVSHRDFYNVYKIDNQIHASSSMNQKHLLRFIKKCLKEHPEENVIVDRDNGNILTLADIFKRLNLTPFDLTINKLDVHCGRDTFHRFDKISSKYNPIGHSQLKEVFLETENLNNGRFFAQLIKEVMEYLKDSKYLKAELRLSIYGRHYDEWVRLAKWVFAHKVESNDVKWMIQLPRIYDVFRSKNLLENFHQMLHNIFTPLFEVTRDPDSYPELHSFLLNVSGFDSVDEDVKSENCFLHESMQPPELWTSQDNPPYGYYLYYIYANMSVLNDLRIRCGLNTFTLRPQCGQTGHVHHLLSGFLLSQSISHGLLLRKAPVLQYLFYFCQVGIVMSPLANNSLSLNYNRNPLYNFLCCGLNVSLSTSDPLQFHFTKEPLMEEYSIATQVWKLTPADMCELAKNSVMISGFSDREKSVWLGENFQKEGVDGNDISKTNVPNIRVSFRYETLKSELNFLLKMNSMCDVN